MGWDWYEDLNDHDQLRADPLMGVLVGKAEPKGQSGAFGQGSQSRFVVTSLHAEQFPTQALYEEFYCARGEMENRIK